MLNKNNASVLGLKPISSDTRGWLPHHQRHCSDYHFHLLHKFNEIDDSSNKHAQVDEIDDSNNKHAVCKSVTEIEQ